MCAFSCVSLLSFIIIVYVTKQRLLLIGSVDATNAHAQIEAVPVDIISYATECSCKQLVWRSIYSRRGLVRLRSETRMALSSRSTGSRLSSAKPFLCLGLDLHDQRGNEGEEAHSCGVLQILGAADSLRRCLRCDHQNSTQVVILTMTNIHGTVCVQTLFYGREHRYRVALHRLNERQMNAINRDRTHKLARIPSCTLSSLTKTIVLRSVSSVRHTIVALH